MNNKNQKDFWAGIMFAAFGIFFIVTAQENELGTAARMGPAYFPTLLGICLTALGIICSLKGILARPENPDDDGKVTAFRWELLGLILGSIAVFCVLLDFTGFVIAMGLMIAICSVAGGEFRTKEVIALVIVIAGLCWVIFVYLLGMVIPVIPPFLIG